MMLNFVCFKSLDGIKHLGSIVRAAHPFPSLSREYKQEPSQINIISPIKQLNFPHQKVHMLITLFIIRLAPRATKMNRILFSQWLPDLLSGDVLLGPWNPQSTPELVQVNFATLYWTKLPKSPLFQSRCFPETTEVTSTVQPKQKRFDFQFLYF